MRTAFKIMIVYDGKEISIIDVLKILKNDRNNIEFTETFFNEPVIIIKEKT